MPTGSDRMRIVSQEAAYWYFRCIGERAMPRADKELFYAWLRRSPENVAAILHVAKMDKGLVRRQFKDRFEVLNSNVIEADFGSGVSQYDYQPCASVSDKVPRKRKPWSRSEWAARAAMVSLVFLLAVVLVNRTPEGMVETAASQLQQMNIEDGSSIHMDARTRLQVAFKTEQRIVHLYTGQAVFDVASDRLRPFTVRTKLVDVTAVGTRFAVRIDESGVTATVEEGIVEVTPRDAEGGEPVRLYPGEQLHVAKTKTPQLSEREKKKVDARQELQWTSGWVDLHGTTVGRIVEEFNRRHKVQVRIDDPALAAAAIDYARVKVTSVESFEQLMKAQEGIVVNKDGSVITLKRRPRSE